jgi:uncharacterized protein YndB with AHSA1/START domain
VAARPEPAASTSDRDLVLTRVFDAPRDLVWQAWTDPKHLANWWGPRGFTSRVHAWDARPGGGIRVDMVAPDGTAYPMGGVFHEVAAPERLVFTATAVEDEDGNPQLEVHTTVTLAERDGKTTLTVRLVAVKVGPAAAGALAGMAEGWRQQLDRLAEDLAAAATEAFVITRVFDAPRDLVFQAWTETGHLTRWFGPVGFTTTARRNDLRPGGVFHYHMRAADGHDMWGKWVYREIAPSERLVFVQSFSDEAGGTTRAPFPSIGATWPLEVLSTVTFAEEGGKTTLTMRGVPINATAEERQTFRGMHGSMRQGWTGTLDQLAAHLTKR